MVRRLQESILIQKLLFIALLVSLNGCKSIQSRYFLSEVHPQKSEIPETIKPTLVPIGFCETKTGPTDPESLSDTWQRVAYQMDLAIPDNQRVRAHKSWYLNHPKYLERVTKRSSPYLYFIVARSEERRVGKEC